MLCFGEKRQGVVLLCDYTNSNIFLAYSVIILYVFLTFAQIHKVSRSFARGRVYRFLLWLESETIAFKSLAWRCTVPEVLDTWTFPAGIAAKNIQIVE